MMDWNDEERSLDAIRYDMPSKDDDIMSVPEMCKQIAIALSESIAWERPVTRWSQSQQHVLSVPDETVETVETVPLPMPLPLPCEAVLEEEYAIAEEEFNEHLLDKNKFAST